MLNLKKFRSSLGPLEQAQVVSSTAVIVTMVTIVSARIFSGYKLGWYDFVSVISVGLFGYLIVYFTLQYGRLLEEQKQELISLNTIAEAVNRAVGIQYLLQSVLQEIKRQIGTDFGLVYQVEADRFVLTSQRGTEEFDRFLIDPGVEVHDPSLKWVRSPRIVRKPTPAEVKMGERWDFGPVEVWASIPITTKEQLLGVIVVGSRRRDDFTNRQIELINAFANHIGVAIENAALFDRLRRSEERYMDLFENSPDMYHIVNREGSITSCNQTEVSRLGYRKEELVGHPVANLYAPEYHSEVRQILEEVFTHGRDIKDLEEQMVTKGGDPIDVSVNTSIIYDDAGNPLLMRVAARDITEKKRLEAKIIHAQRIDSIGNLAGGVAHDFNNILTSILGSTSIMKRKMKSSDTWYRFVDIIETAAKRGAGLTRQLLTFARKSTVQFRPVIVNEIVSETLRLFERSIDKTITVKHSLTPDDCIINGDDGQIQQALLNILINARDAMPEGGVITVRSDLADFRQQPNRSSETRTGKYVSISITDTGVGMDKRMQQHIFEPFFTTKDQGKGTGLGLSVVYGVVNSHNGFITVNSELSMGSQFVLYFPLMSGTEPVRTATRTQKSPRGKEHILIVDDEREVRAVLSVMLEDLGYRVTAVESGKKAIALYKKKKRFDLILLDMNMPTMGGKETFGKIKEIDPDVRVVISTGYSNRTMESSPLRDAVDAILQKPYQIEELSTTVRSVLDRRPVQES